MNFLPSIEVLSFLDWLDKKGNADLKDSTIEEFVLNPENNEKLLDTIDYYKKTRKKYEKTVEGEFERKLDYYLRNVKAEVMNRYNQYSPIRKQYLDDWYFEEMIHSVQEQFRKDHRVWVDDRDIEDISSINTEEFADRLRGHFYYGSVLRNDPVFPYLERKEGTSTHTINCFIRWIKRNYKENVKINQIPDSILEEYLNSFLDEYYQFHRNVSFTRVRKMKEIIKNALHNSSNIEYFNDITERYRDRVARYKCVFLSEDDAFYKLVEENWIQLHEYTADYLDIFYNPKELTPYRGFDVAEVLRIRNRVDVIPCIYIWRTVLSEGDTITTKGLNFENLLQLIKEVVDSIVAGMTFNDIIAKGNEYAELLKRQLNKNHKIEEKVLRNLIRACVQLQNNPDMYSDANENQKNTLVRDLMRNLFDSPLCIGDEEYSISIEDQTLNGFSASGKSAGELDLFVRVGTLPYTIIEGIDIEADKQGKKGKHWVRSKLYEHIVRFGNYDQNGLERNILLVYVKTDDFDGFYESMLNGIINSPKAIIRGNRIYDLANMPLSEIDISEYASIRLARGKYIYSGCERTLYICVVKISS